MSFDPYSSSFILLSFCHSVFSSLLSSCLFILLSQLTFNSSSLFIGICLVAFRVLFIVFLYFCLFMFLSFFVSVYLCFCLFVYLSFCASDFLLWSLFHFVHWSSVIQGGITCRAINKPRKSSKAINKRVIIKFHDKNVVFLRFRNKKEVFILFICIYIYIFNK